MYIYIYIYLYIHRYAKYDVFLMHHQEWPCARPFAVAWLPCGLPVRPVRPQAPRWAEFSLGFPHVWECLGYFKGILCNFCLFKHVGCLNQFWECDLFSYFLNMILNGFWIQLCSLKSGGF